MESFHWMTAALTPRIRPERRSRRPSPGAPGLGGATSAAGAPNKPAFITLQLSLVGLPSLHFSIFPSRTPAPGSWESLWRLSLPGLCLTEKLAVGSWPPFRWLPMQASLPAGAQAAPAGPHVHTHTHVLTCASSPSDCHPALTPSGDLHLHRDEFSGNHTYWEECWARPTPSVSSSQWLACQALPQCHLRISPPSSPQQP